MAGYVALSNALGEPATAGGPLDSQIMGGVLEVGGLHVEYSAPASGLVTYNVDYELIRQRVLVRLQQVGITPLAMAEGHLVQVENEEGTLIYNTATRTGVQLPLYGVMSPNLIEQHVIVVPIIV